MFPNVCIQNNLMKTNFGSHVLVNKYVYIHTLQSIKIH